MIAAGFFYESMILYMGDVQTFVAFIAVAFVLFLNFVSALYTFFRW